MKPTYPTPLAVRFANLSMLIKQQVALAGKQHPNQSIASIVAGDVRVERLQSSSDKLQLWASIVRRPMKESLVGDVLESLEVSGSSLCDELHGIFSGIASHVIKCVLQSSAVENEIAIEMLMCCSDGPCGWDQYLKKLGDLIPKIHQEYADFQREEVPRPSRQRLVLCFGEWFSTSHGLRRCHSDIRLPDGGGVASFSSLLILRALMCRITKIIEESAAQDDGRLFLFTHAIEPS